MAVNAGGEGDGGEGRARRGVRWTGGRRWTGVWRGVAGIHFKVVGEAFELMLSFGVESTRHVVVVVGGAWRHAGSIRRQPPSPRQASIPARARNPLYVSRTTTAFDHIA